MKNDNAKIKIDDLQKELEEATNNWKRALADYQNLEKRTQEEKLNFSQFANSQLILKLLPVLDSFGELVKLDKLGQDEHLNLVVKQFRDILNSEGLEKIEVTDKEFNPQEMECVEIVEGEEGKAVAETRTGYKLKGKILRVSQVKVGKEVKN